MFNNMGTIDVVVFVVYVLCILAVGFYTSRKISSSNDFSSAAQSLTTPVVMGSLLATFFGGYMCAGGPEYVYNYGIAALICVFGYPTGLLIMSFMAKFLRKSGARTYPEFIFMQFGEKAQIASSVASVGQLLGQTAGQYIAAGSVAALLGLCSFEQGIVIGGILILLLSVSGGLKGVALTDTVQFIFIITICLITVPVLCFHNAGGVSFVFENTDPSKFQLFAYMTPFALLSGFVANTFSYISEPGYAQRIFAAKDSKVAFKGSLGATLIGYAMTLPVFLAVFTIPFIFPDIEMPSQFVPTAIVSFMPPAIKGLGIAAFASLLLTTGDTFLMAVSSIITTDIWPKFRPNDSDKTLLRVGRLSIIIIGIMGILIGLYFQNIYNVMVLFFGAYGACVTVPVLLSWFAKDKIDNRAVAPGMWLSWLLTISIDAIHGGQNGVFFGIALNLAWILIGSAYYRNKDKKLSGNE